MVLLTAIDKMLMEAASRVTWGQRRTSRRNAVWSPLMATHTAALNFPKTKRVLADATP